MLQLYRDQSRLRRLIAAAATFAISFQLLLSAIVIGQVSAWQTGDTFVICHGGGGSSPIDQDRPAKQPGDGSHCVLCTLMHGASAVLPAVSAAVPFAPGACSRNLARQSSQVSEYRSPTGRFQRGPPSHMLVAG
jgi:hypothetical protein